MPTDSAAYVTAPRQGQIRVLDLSTTASAALDLGDQVGRYWTFDSDVDCFVIFAGRNDATSLPAPNPAARTGSGTGHAWRVPANTPMHVYIGPQTRYLRVVGAAAGVLRYAPSGA